LHGEVPQYETYSTDDPRDCSPPKPYAYNCYLVITKARDEESWALIVQNIIRADNVEATTGRMAYAYIQSHEGIALGRACAFRDEAIEQAFVSQRIRSYGWGSPIVIDGVYIWKEEDLYPN
jgi:hypothetical protein